MTQDPEAGMSGSATAIDALLAEVEGIAAMPNELDAVAVERIDWLLRAVEQATPLGAGLHARLDAVRRWVDVLRAPVDHARFGGTDHVRRHVLTQVAVARAAARDYVAEMP